MFQRWVTNMEREIGVPIVVYPDRLLVLVETRFIICNKTENNKESIKNPSQVNKLTIIGSSVISFMGST